MSVTKQVDTALSKRQLKFVTQQPKYKDIRRFAFARFHGHFIQYFFFQFSDALNCRMKCFLVRIKICNISFALSSNVLFLDLIVIISEFSFYWLLQISLRGCLKPLSSNIYSVCCIKTASNSNILELTPMQFIFQTNVFRKSALFNVHHVFSFVSCEY